MASSGLLTLESRWARLVLAGEAAWLIYVVFELVQTSLVANFPLHWNLLGDRVDIPFGLADALLKLGFRMDVGVPASLPNTRYFPAMGYLVFSFTIGITLAIAAVRGRWLLFFACLLPAFVSPSVFGASPGPIAVLTLLSGALAVGRCVMKREQSMIVAIIAACAAAFVAQVYVTTHDAHSPSIRVTRAPDARELATVSQLDRALSQVQNADADIAYVRAQIAYLHDDRARLQAIGPLDPEGIQATPYSRHRLRILNTAVAHMAKAPDPAPLGSKILRIIGMALLLPALALLIVTRRLRWRMRRIVKIMDTMKGLPPLRPATP